MRRTALAAALGLALLTSDVAAQQPKAATALAEALKLCTANLMQPEQFTKAWADAGYTISLPQAISAKWLGMGFNRGDTTLTTTELKFSDSETKSCQYTASVSITLDDAKAFAAVLAKDSGLGPMEMEVGAVPAGLDTKMVMAAMHRTGNNPLIGGTITARDGFLFLVFVRTDLKAK
jgi:hypothetical protein